MAVIFDVQLVFADMDEANDFITRLRPTLVLDEKAGENVLAWTISGKPMKLCTICGEPINNAKNRNKRIHDNCGNNIRQQRHRIKNNDNSKDLLERDNLLSTVTPLEGD